jgi:hypothetical protein
VAAVGAFIFVFDLFSPDPFSKARSSPHRHIDLNLAHLKLGSWRLAVKVSVDARVPDGCAVSQSQILYLWST